MKLAILSDFHFGHMYSTELENDSFENADEAMREALDSDLILIAGDIFDSRIPRTAVWAKAAKVLVKPLLKESTGVKQVDCTKELKEISKRALRHLPVVALHGTHERRHEINAIQALENAGILIHLHCNTIVFEKSGVKVAIHGMSGVPERYAKNVLERWSPKPLPDCKNILVLHQSIEPYIYSPLEPLSLKVSDLPKGFDLIVNGHIHIPKLEKIDGTILLMPGSTVTTQLEKNEAEVEKGFYEVEFGEEMKIDFKPLKNNRKFFYEEIKVAPGLAVREQIETKLNEILSKSFAKPPIVKLKICGEETEVIDQELKEIERKYAGKVIINFAKELESPEMMEKIEFLRNLREQKLSIEEIGVEMLKKNLDELAFFPIFDYENVFGLLSEGNVDQTFNILMGQQKTLGAFKNDNKS